MVLTMFFMLIVPDTAMAVLTPFAPTSAVIKRGSWMGGAKSSLVEQNGEVYWVQGGGNWNHGTYTSVDFYYPSQHYYYLDVYVHDSHLGYTFITIEYTDGSDDDKTCWDGRQYRISLDSGKTVKYVNVYHAGFWDTWFKLDQLALIH